jgi:hypothetical protein
MDPIVYTFRRELCQYINYKVCKESTNAFIPMRGQRIRALTYLSELSPIGLYLLISEFTAHDGPKYAVAVFT